MLERLPSRMLGWAKRRARPWRGGADHLTILVWGLALAPCLIVPPIIAIALVWRNDGHGRALRGDTAFVTIVACVNVVFSLVLIGRFGHEVLAIVESWRRDWQPGPPGGQPRLTPI